MANFTVIFDANVLYPAPLRSLLMYLALADLFRARWTIGIHEEWVTKKLNKDDEIGCRKKLQDFSPSHLRMVMVV